MIRGSSMRRAVAACGVSLAAIGSGSATPPLFLADTPFDPPASNRIYEVDPATGVLTLRADLGPDYSPMLGLAAASGTVLYAIGSDNSGTVCAGEGFACLLLRIELDPFSTVPASVDVIGPVTVGGVQVDELTGLSFRNTAALYAISQETDGLYIVDTATAAATLVGTSNANLYGGDLTFDSQDRLWVWVNPNGGAGTGLYQMDPETAQATRTASDSTNMSGLAAIGHSDQMYGSDPPANRLWDVLPVTGRTGTYEILTLDGSVFDHKRGDLDSPYCEDDSVCEDSNPCTVNRCGPGGCVFLFEDATCDGVDDDCDGLFDEDFVSTPTTCGVGACSGNTGQLLCSGGTLEDTCDPFEGASSTDPCDGIDNDCDGTTDEGFPDFDLDGSADCVDPDDDNDGVLDVEDCAPFDPVKTAGPPAEVRSVVWAGVPREIRWADQGEGVFYDIVSGSISALRADGGVSGATCLADDLAAPQYLDPRADPAPGSGYYYLIRAQKAACGAGTYGFASSGAERIPNSDCP